MDWYLGCGVVFWLQNGVGLIPANIPVQPTLPNKYVEPSYVLARPPSRQSYRVNDVLASLRVNLKKLLSSVKIKGGMKDLWCCNFESNLMVMCEALTTDP